MASSFPAAHGYVVKLRAPDPAHPEVLRGRLEHLTSGRRHDFDSGEGLLACLQGEQLESLRGMRAAPFPFDQHGEPDTPQPAA